MGNEKETGTAVAEVKKSPRALMIEQVGSKLEAMIAEQINAFPKSFNKTRFIQNCLVVLADTKDIERCKPISVVRTLIKGAYLNLDFFRRECYAIPYENKETGELICNFQTDYKGERKLCLEYGRGIKDIYAKLVQEGDDFSIGIESGNQFVNFNPKPFNDGPITGAFAVVLMENGSTRYETMSIKELEEVRQNYSKMPNSPAYKKSLGEMYKKIVMRRACKLIDLHFQNHEQQAAFEDGGEADLKKDKPKIAPQQVADPFAEEAPGAAPKIEDAQLVQGDPDAKLRAELKAKYPEEAEWQITARIKESKGGQ